MSARILVVQHETICPPGRLESWLTDAGVGLEVVHPYAGDALPGELDHDGLVVLGGTMGANDDDGYWWLAPTKRLLADAVLRGVPTLGVCLGHQLLAVACGGRVETNALGSTIGLRSVDPADPQSGDDDRHLAWLPADAVAIHWNDDVVTRPPPNATVLATTADGSPQVMRVGERAWGVQFHPEADASIVAAWADRSVASGVLPASDAASRLAEIAGVDAELAAIWQPCAERFAALVLS